MTGTSLSRVLPWPPVIRRRWPLLHVLRGGGRFSVPSRHGESAALVATPVSPLIRPAMHDAAKTTARRSVRVRAVGSPDRTAAPGPARWGWGGGRWLSEVTQRNPSWTHLKRLNARVPSLAFVSSWPCFF